MVKVVTKVMFWIVQVLAAMITAIMLYVSILIVGVLFWHGGDNHQGGDVTIFVKSNGIHTDITMPVESDWHDWKTFIPTKDYPNNKTFRYISIGWGDRGFFIDTPEWSDLTATTLLTAMFVPSDCAMHVEYMDAEPVLSDHCFQERITANNYSELVQYICSTFVVQDDKLDMYPNASYWGTDRFYKAKGSYHLLNTCNSWTNGALKSAGLETALFSFFPDGIMNYRN